ncbi:Oxysterol-binding protein [Backusella circina FSU 941]|nr:Oxysterol-binding protein [Backusella circina FSU 941]KAI8885944.1 Oxysterol-binding protein [Backusella circina FSU 941]
MAEKGEVNNVDKIPTEQKGAFHSFLKSLASFSGDLSSLTCPAFLLAPVSLIEYSEYWTQQPDLFVAITKPDDEVERMINFVKWFISSLNASYSRRVPKGEWEKKPYNPILGEQFKMHWDEVDGSGETSVLCEQVSHHPPVTGFNITNEKFGVTLNGHTGQKTRFSGTSLICDQVGQSVVNLNQRNEKYMFTCPSITVNGIWYAAPYVELTGTSYIQSSTGLYCSIEYTSRGWVSGERNHFKCYLRRNDSKNSKEYLYKMEGQWSGKSTITEYGAKKSNPFLDVTQLTPATMHVKELEEQDEMESRKVWQKVSDAIRANDTQTAGTEKNKLETKQREERAQREEENQTWKPKYFSWEEEEPNVVFLQSMLTDSVGKKYFTPTTAGNWVFNNP